jgi:hypothetical protein
MGPTAPSPGKHPHVTSMRLRALMYNNRLASRAEVAFRRWWPGASHQSQLWSHPVHLATLHASTAHTTCTQKHHTAAAAAAAARWRVVQLGTLPCQQADPSSEASPANHTRCTELSGNTATKYCATSGYRVSACQDRAQQPECRCVACSSPAPLMWRTSGDCTPSSTATIYCTPSSTATI